ncbi:MAG: STAS domain-containing protein [Mycobacteriaceae bacterium]|nr:STAS domain-containing protein [Mycobacteriaceae bacterium]
MTATITTSAFVCGNARIRSHRRHLATIVTIDGLIDTTNLDRVIEVVRRFVLAKDPLVLDLSNVNHCALEALSLPWVISEDCSAAGVEWILVPSAAICELLCANEAAFPVARSVQEALHDFADMIDTRRQLLLPLVRKTA